MAAQFIIVKGKEYKVVNWIDGCVCFTTFSAAGKESNVRSEKTKAIVMAALVEHAHDVANGMNEYADFQALTSQQQAIHHARVAYGLDLASMYCTDVLTACHTLALMDDKTFNLQRRVEAQIAAGHPVDEEGNDTREWSGASIQADHAEALATDAERTAQINALPVFETHRTLFAVANEYVRSVMINDAHEAALSASIKHDRVVAMAPTTKQIRGDELVAGMVVLTPDGNLTISRIETVTDNELRVYWTTGQIGRSLYLHTLVQVVA